MKIRLDIMVAKINAISRTKAKLLIENYLVKVNNKISTKTNECVSDLDAIEIMSFPPNTSSVIAPSKKKLEIFHEDKYLLIVNKGSGQLTHPTNMNENSTLANNIKYYFLDKGIITDFEHNDKRWGICHRLDKNTSGLIIVAKSKECFLKITNMLEEKKVKRFYLALIWKSLKTNVVKAELPIKRKNGSNERVVSTDSDAKNSVTIFSEIKKFSNFSLINCQLETGRTHQIRAHLKYIGNPIINDPIYGINKKTTNYCQYLVANKIYFIHPYTNEDITIEIKMPKEFIKYIKENE